MMPSRFEEYRRQKRLPENTRDFLEMMLEEYPEILHPTLCTHDELIAHLSVRAFLLKCLHMLKGGDDDGNS